MRAVCNWIVEGAGDWWNYIGWGLFAGWIAIPLMASQSGLPPFVLLSIFLLWLVWWAIDLVYQTVSVWQIAIGIAMLVVGFLPLGFVLVIACWVIYWTRVRE